MPIKIENGNLLKKFKELKFDGIAHGCNCFFSMSAGIADQIRVEYIDAYKADLATGFGDVNKLGTYSVTKVGDNGALSIFNLYTQYRPGREVETDLYEYIKAAFELLNKDLGGKNYVLGIPKIGSGIAGGVWTKIEKIIRKATPDLTVVVVNYVPEMEADIFDDFGEKK